MPPPHYDFLIKASLNHISWIHLPVLTPSSTAPAHRGLRRRQVVSVTEVLRRCLDPFIYHHNRYRLQDPHHRTRRKTNQTPNRMQPSVQFHRSQVYLNPLTSGTLLVRNGSVPLLLRTTGAPWEFCSSTTSPTSDHLTVSLVPIHPSPPLLSPIASRYPYVALQH